MSLFICILFRNVITHSSCVVYVLDLVMISNLVFVGEEMVRWIALRNLVLEDAWTQCSDIMWHWDMSFRFNCMMFRTYYFTLFYSAVSDSILSLFHLNPVSFVSVLNFLYSFSCPVVWICQMFPRGIVWLYRLIALGFYLHITQAFCIFSCM